MIMRARMLSLVAVGLGLALVGCSSETPSRESRTWRCARVAVPGGATLECTSAAVTYDGEEPPRGGTRDGEPGQPGGLGADGFTNGGIPLPGSTNDGDPLAGGSAGGGASGGASSANESGGSTHDGEDDEGFYGCTAGTRNCPPLRAIPGTNVSDVTNPSGTGASKGGESSTGGAPGTGGSDQGDTADGERDGDQSGDGSSGRDDRGERYLCKKKGKTCDCVKEKPTECKPGMKPSGGACVPDSTEDGKICEDLPATKPDGGITIRLDHKECLPDGTKTWTYEVCESSGSQDLSNWVIATNCPIECAKPEEGFERVNPDPNSGLRGGKWNTPSHEGCQAYTIKTRGGQRGLVKVAAKAPDVHYGMVEGPVCQ